MNQTFRPRDRPTVADRGRPPRIDEFGYFLQIRRHEEIFTEELFAVAGLRSLTQSTGGRNRRTLNDREKGRASFGASAEATAEAR